ncbi:hypothetical protein SK3146_05068 [Paenibacillus konkukensis]|uniref:Uncharacterized protein n=1 Tax=Paenibacillus konkukensis TaxID=2020716 RepID=A0ABY4RT92_9BACL|nr:hypothetical protein [Paenibacillus konkukensis]UQZ85779.1 hypothetical protein SK3146_05068 [Paenibacillus konkukensis]
MQEQKKSLDINRIMEQLQISAETYERWSGLEDEHAPAADKGFSACGGKPLYPVFHWEMNLMEYSR